MLDLNQPLSAFSGKPVLEATAGQLRLLHQRSLGTPETSKEIEGLSCTFFPAAREQSADFVVHVRKPGATDVGTREIEHSNARDRL